MSHAASAFYPSPFEHAAVLTVDGVGEWATTAYFVGEGKIVRPIREIDFPDSLGMLYAAITAFLGFKVNEDEYKVMGLASYGRPRYLDKMRELITLHDDGSFKLNLNFFSFMYDGSRMYSDRLIELLGSPRGEGAEIDERHIDIAASLQYLTEEAIV